jgi:hypothetical protein
MTDQRTTESVQLIEVAAEVLPAPTRCNLHSIGHIRREMASVYRMAKSGELTTQDAGRLIYMLAEIRKCAEIEEIEQRLDRLEQRA